MHVGIVRVEEFPRLEGGMVYPCYRRPQRLDGLNLRGLTSQVTPDLKGQH